MCELQTEPSQSCAPLGLDPKKKKMKSASPENGAAEAVSVTGRSQEEQGCETSTEGRKVRPAGEEQGSLGRSARARPNTLSVLFSEFFFCWTDSQVNALPKKCGLGFGLSWKGVTKALPASFFQHG